MATFVKYYPQASGSSSQIKRVFTSDALYNAQNDDHYIGVDSSINPVTIVLPNASESGNGKILVIKDESGKSFINNIIIEASGVDKVDTNPQFIIASNLDSVTLVCDGIGNWYII